MDHDKLNTLLQLLEGTCVTELDYAGEDWKVRLTRGLCSGSGPEFAAASEGSLPAVATATREQALPPVHVVTAGLTGTFFRAPAPDQPPFISVGDTVLEGQTVGVVEAMKLLNTIEADCAGRVVEIFAEDGVAVLPDSKLIAIEPLEVSHV